MYDYKSPFAICVINTLVGCVAVDFVRIPDENPLPLVVMGASFCWSILTWTALFLMMAKRDCPTWERFMVLCNKSCMAYMAVTFVAAGLLEQPAIGMAGWGHVLMVSVFARFIGCLVGGTAIWFAIIVIKSIQYRRLKNAMDARRAA